MEQKVLSCEQFVIEDLLKTREENENLRKINTDLKNKIEQLESVECQAINKCGIYFIISETSYTSDFVRLSKLFTLEDIKNAIDLAEQDIFEDLDEIRNRDVGYSDYIAKCKTEDYTQLIIHGGHEFVINISSYNDSFIVDSKYIDKKHCFLDEVEAIKQARKIAIKNLKEYVEWYEEKHKGDEE